MTHETAEQELARLRAENAALKATKPAPGALSFKVSNKGAVSVYGLGRFPVTLYVGQWERLLAVVPQLGQFIEDHRSELKTKSTTIEEE